MYLEVFELVGGGALLFFWGAYLPGAYREETLGSRPTTRLDRVIHWFEAGALALFLSFVWAAWTVCLGVFPVAAVAYGVSLLL